ncbi:MAG: hypothetical protein JO260_02765, partial [Acidobacteria bacterium]|nr:hypothetical protein [Acidobacteriota bacterium]
GVAFVPPDFPSGGMLSPGDLLVANFNNNVPPAGLQGTGTTIVKVNPNAAPSLFFTSSQVGLSTALGVLKRGFVIVGNLPSTDGSGSCVAESGPDQNVGPGALQIIDREGNLRATLTGGLLNGPWDLTIKDDGDHASVFVANALTGTVARLDLRVSSDYVKVEKETQIASGYVHRCDPNAFVVAPTGLALNRETDTLFVASTGDNAIFAISDASDRHSDAGTGKLFIQDNTHLHGPLGLALAPNGNLLSAQGDAVNPDPKHVSEIVEFSPHGKFVDEFAIDPAAGSAFGLAIRRLDDGFVFAAVDDGTNVLDVWEVR